MSEGAAPQGAPSNGAPRNNAGQFSPKAGATGVVPQEGATSTQTPVNGATNGTDAPPSGPQSPEDWSFEDEVDVYGQKQKVQWKSKAEAKRAAQELFAYQKRVRDIAAAEKRIAEYEAQRQAQGDPEEHFRRRVIEAAQLSEMNPLERELYALRQEKQQWIDQQQQAKQQEELRVKQAERAQLRLKAVEGLERGLEMSGLPKTHHTMALLAEIQQECADQKMPPLPPELLAKEANRRYAERGVEPLRKMTGKSLLDRLGQDVVRNILLAVREQRGIAAAQPRQTASIARELPPQESDKVYGEAEAEARLRALRNSR